MNALFKTLKRKPVQTSAERILRTSSFAPASGITALDNSEGFSQAAAELIAAAGSILKELTIDDDLRDQAQAAVQRLDTKASKYFNNSLDFCTQKEPWSCDMDRAHLISIAWRCVQTVYLEDPAAQQKVDSDLSIDFAIPSSKFGSIKATTFTKYTPILPLGSSTSPYLVIAVRGSASKFDHVVNLNGEPRDATKLLESSSAKTPLALQAHAGFLNAAIELLPQVSRRISKFLDSHPTGNILFAGHSAGGAVVSLLHMAVLQKYEGAATEASFSCITFGAPPSIKVLSENNQLALGKLIPHSSTLNLVNEYDMVTRLDNEYFRSMISLYNLPSIPEAELASDTDDNDKKEIAPTVLQCPRPALQHLGELVVLRVEAPKFGPSPDSTPQMSSRLSAWKVPPSALSDLLFCRLTVHRREAYRQRIEDLGNGLFNGQNGWKSTTNEALGTADDSEGQLS